MPHYFFDVKNGHRQVDPSGANFKTDKEAIANGKILAQKLGLLCPLAGASRYVIVLNDGGDEIDRLPVENLIVS